ncbi:MAG: sugar kinase [Acidobacteria bacterium]|nr:sugar kinase [Acidobacteriota bacterium]
MERLTENKIILITRKTRIDDLIARFNTLEQAKFYVEHLGADFSDYLAEDRNYKQAISDAEETLRRLGRLHILDRQYLTNFLFGKDDTIIVLGQDGLVANTLKYLDSQCVIGVNPEPRRWEGVLLPFRVRDLEKIIPEVFRQNRKYREITMAKAELNNGLSLYGVNDIFIGPKTHGSARYNIRTGTLVENQSSSGIIVSTGLGATGWFRSIITGAVGVAAASLPGGRGTPDFSSFTWDSRYLYFSVREPWPSKYSSANIVFGQITENHPLELESHMSDNGVIFSDGIEKDFLEFNSGTKASVTIADKVGRLIV